MYIIEESTFRKIELPDIIYKYRSFADEKERRMLTNNEVYLANPDEFIKKGSKDCDFDVKYKEYSDEELFKFYSKSMSKKWVSKSPYKDAPRRQILEELLKKRINECLGIFCASNTWKNRVLWKKPFGDSSEGFCVGFNAEKLIRHIGFVGGGDLFYHEVDNKPILTCDPINNMKIDKKEVHAFIMSLPNNFNEENEYRLYKQSQLDMPLQKEYYLPNGIIEEVIFVEFFDIINNKEIIHQLKDKGIRVYQAKDHSDQPDIIREKL